MPEVEKHRLPYRLSNIMYELPVLQGGIRPITFEDAHARSYSMTAIEVGAIVLVVAIIGMVVVVIKFRDGRRR